MESNVVSLPVRQPIYPVAGNTSLATVYPSLGNPMQALEHPGWKDWAVADPSANFNAIKALRDAQHVEAPAPQRPRTHGTAMVNRAALGRAMAALVKIVERKNTIPILANVRLTGVAGGVRLIATDLDIEASAVVAGESDGLDVTVPAHTLADIVKRAKKAESVTISYGDSKKDEVAFGFDGLTINLQALPAAEFPELATRLQSMFTVETAVFYKALDKASLAISTEETRYYLNGVYLHVEPPHLRMDCPPTPGALHLVATDGHRLVRYSLPYVESMAQIPGIIIPRKTVAEVLRNIKGKGRPNTVTVETGKNKGGADCRIRFTIGGLVITSKLIDGTFPDYQRVIPLMNDKRMIVDRKAFDSAIEQVAVISSDHGRAIKIAVETGKVRLTVTNSDAGSATMEMAADYAPTDPAFSDETRQFVEAAPMEIGFNASYLRAMLTVIDGDSVEMRLADAGSPTLFSDPTDPAFTAVLMPMRV